MSRNSIHPTQRIIQFTLGIALVAWGFRALLVENQILSGGLPGLSLLLYRLLDLSPTISQWLIGIPILALAWFLLGKKMAINSLAGATLLPAAIYAAKFLPAVPCEQPILASIFGGLIIGIGLGLTFASNATTGGFSVLARILHKYTDLSVANAILLLDGTIIICTIAFFGAEAAMLAMLCIIATSKAIDIVLTGFGLVKSVTIITDQPQAIREMVLTRINAGATEIPATGAHSQQNKTVFITVIPRAKAARLRRNIQRTDPKAFTIISDASEVQGYGFANHG